MQFVADAMLGKLARWLRMMGYDTLCAADMPVDDDDLLTIAVDEKRILLTRDKELYNRAKELGISAVLLRDKDLEHQLAQLVMELGVELHDEPQMICPSCNGRLIPVSKNEVAGIVPATVLDTHDEFWMCTSCGQVYWEGNHWKKIRETVRKVRELVK